MTDKISLHDIGVYFCYTLGGCLFLFGKCGILNMFISFALGILSFVGFYYLFKSRFAKKPLLRFLFTVLCVFAVCFTFCEFAKFTSRRILITTPHFAIVLLFLGIITAFLLATEKAILKFCLVFFILGLSFCLVVITASLANFESANLDCLPGIEIKEIFKNYIIIFLPAFIPSLKHEPSLKSGLAGISIAGGLIMVFSLLTVCTFGRLNDMLSYPILSLADTISFGKIFTRLGLYLHAVMYVTGLIRCVISIIKIKYIYSLSR